MSLHRHKPQLPRFARWLLTCFHPPETLEEVEGDLAELYTYWYERQGKHRAQFRYLWSVLSVLPPFVRKRVPKPAYPHQTLHLDMLRNYITIAFRNLVRHRVSSFINIFGLAAGMAVAVLIGLWVYDELTFNRNHEHYDHIVKVYRKQQRGGEAMTSNIHTTGLGTVLKNQYADYFSHVVMVRANLEDRVVAHGYKKYTQSGYFMQPEGADMLTLQMVYGSRQGLTDLKSILLSETFAKKLFGAKNPLNEIVQMDARWDLLVTGVYKDLPKNSEFSEATYFAPLDLYLDGNGSLTAWDNYHMYIYAQLKPEVRPEQVSAVVKDAMVPHVGVESGKPGPEIFLHPMSRWHLYSDFENGQLVTSNELTFVRLCAIIGLFVLLLACINFMNLSTARSAMRAKEVGIRKTIGSMRSQLVSQFLSESVLVAILAFMLSILMVQFSLSWFNQVAGKEMSILWGSPLFWLAAIGFTLGTGLLAGSYPALYLSSFMPVKVLKGTLGAGRSAALPRKVLVTFQFTVSIVLIMGTLVVYQQIEHAKNRPVGYNRSGLISLRSPDYSGKYQVLHEELKKIGAVTETAQANYPLTNTKGNNSGFGWRGKDPRMEPDPTFNTIQVTHEYGKTINLEFISGRDFSRAYSTDKNGVIINESAAKLLGLGNPVGEVLRSPEGMGGKNFQVLGVVKDMVKDSPFGPTVPSIIFLSEDNMGWLFIRLNPALSASEALPKIENVFKKIVPSADFAYRFADAEYALKFAAEERVGKLAAVFAALTILISCMGLFGLATYMAEQRTKEIGIRKVMGATVLNLWGMLSKDFVYLVILAFLIATPLAYYFLSGWLQNFEYHIGISWWVFGAAGLSALLITLLTVSIQSIKAALANPVKSLRSE